jgi:hypothetical protein
MKTFMEWLFHENATVAQLLKAKNDPNIPDIKNAVRHHLQKMEQFKKLGPEGDYLVNFLTKNTLEEMKSSLPRKGAPISDKVRMDTLVANHANQLMNRFGDFIFGTWPQTKSKLNNASYTTMQLKADSDMWHEDIAARKAEMPSDEYETFIELKGPWQGWKWASLGRGYCSQEAKAMGHCGNSGAIEGDNILSLRDPEGKAHLTFIVNDGILGEMKGRGNSKPSKRYHPAIMELLKHPSIHVIKGGGYAPERNFSLKDLQETDRKIIEAIKPNIGNMVKHMLQTGRKYEIASHLSLVPKDMSLEGDTVTLKQYDLEDLGNIVSTDDKEGMGGFGHWFGGDMDFADNISWDISWNDMSHKADDELEDTMIRVAKEEGHEVDDAEAAWDASNSVREALSSAYKDAYVSGSEKDAWESFKKAMDSSDENGFWVDMENHPYRLQIHSQDLSDFISKTEELDLEDYLQNKESFKFESPYGGFSGFDKEMFLDNAKVSLKSEVGEK